MNNSNNSQIPLDDCQPPSDNMGVEFLKSNDLFVPALDPSWHVDFLTVTIWTDSIRQQFDDFFASRGIFRPLKDLGHGGRFYYSMFVTDLGVTVRENPYDGSGHCTIEIPGTACQILGYQGLADFVQILRLNYEKVRFNRIDTAFDRCKFTVQDVIACIESEDLRSLFKRDTVKTFRNMYERKDGEENLPCGSGTSGLTIGGRSSTRYLRVYDKHGYTRLEVEYKGDKAEQVGHDIFDCKDEEVALKFAMGHVADYVEFFTEWWDLFMGDYERLYAKLPKDVQEISIDKIKLWFESQIASAFFVMASLGGSEYFDFLKYVGQQKYVKSRYNGLIEMGNISERIRL